VVAVCQVIGPLVGQLGQRTAAIDVEGGLAGCAGRQRPGLVQRIQRVAGRQAQAGRPGGQRACSRTAWGSASQRALKMKSAINASGSIPHSRSLTL